MGWNYRVLAKKQSDDSIFLDIYEVYYDEDGNPEYCTENPITVGGDDLEDIQWQLDKMRDALSKPVLNYDDFPHEFKRE